MCLQLVATLTPWKKQGKYNSETPGAIQLKFVIWGSDNEKDISTAKIVWFCRNSTKLWGHSIPNQQKESLPSWIFMKFGTDMDSTKKLSYTTIWLILFISL